MFPNIFSRMKFVVFYLQAIRGDSDHWSELRSISDSQHFKSISGQFADLAADR